MNRRSELIWQDTQHNMLFKLIDELAENDQCSHVIHQLKLYADHHFCLEEAYMVRLDYPNYESHLMAHNRFREELMQLEAEYARAGMTQNVRQTISSFLTEWLTRHIMSIDKDFEVFVLESDSK
jgi:hemerythrin